MIKQCLTFVLLAINSIFCDTAMGEESLVIHLRRGGVINCLLEKKPILSFGKDSMMVNGEMTSFAIPLIDVDFFDFKTNTNTDIKSLSQQSQIRKPIFVNGHIVFSKLAIGSRVYVYSIDGKQLCCYSTDCDNNVDIDLSMLPRGIYVIKCQNSSLKIFNR